MLIGISDKCLSQPIKLKHLDEYYELYITKDRDEQKFKSAEDTPLKLFLSSSRSLGFSSSKTFSYALILSINFGKLHKVPNLKRLYKQIGSQKKTISFLPGKFESDNELLKSSL